MIGRGSPVREVCALAPVVCPEAGVTGRHEGKRCTCAQQDAWFGGGVRKGRTDQRGATEEPRTTPQTTMDRSCGATDALRAKDNAVHHAHEVLLPREFSWHQG